MSTIPSISANSIIVTNGGSSWTTASNLHSHTIYTSGGSPGPLGHRGPSDVPSFIPIFDKDKGEYIAVPYWEFHKVYEEHLILKKLAEEFPAVKLALNHLETVIKLHRED